LDAPYLLIAGKLEALQALSAEERWQMRERRPGKIPVAHPPVRIVR